MCDATISAPDRALAGRMLETALAIVQGRSPDIVDATLETLVIARERGMSRADALQLVADVFNTPRWDASDHPDLRDLRPPAVRAWKRKRRTPGQRKPSREAQLIAATARNRAERTDQAWYWIGGD